MIAQAIALAVTAALSAGGAWQYQSARYERLLSDQRTEYLKRDFTALEVAHAETVRLQSLKDAAQKQAAARQSALARDAAGVRVALVSLSDAADQALRASRDSHSACIDRSAAFADVFSQCRSRLQVVGAAADAHASDITTLISAWPK